MMRPDEQEGALLDACKRALRVIDTSIYQGEVFTSYTSTISAELEKGKIKSSQSGYEGGVGVRVYKSGSMGYAHASLERVEFAVERAISAARAGNPDKDFRSLALPENYPTVNGTWDRKVASLDADAVVQLTTDVADACRIDERIDIVNSGASVGRWSDAVANTLGVAGAESGTQASLDVDVVAHIGDATGNGFEYAASRRFDFDLDAIGRAAGEMALASVNPKPIRSGKMPVVIDPLAVGPIIAAAVTVSAEDAQRDRSFLAGRTGDRVAVSAFTIVDDGLLNGGLETSSFDAEGVPSQRTPLIEKGIFNSYLYDTYAANKEDRKSTGNASRSDFRSSPSISPTNLVISRGTDKNVVEEVQRGIYVRATGDRPNITTGEFSGLVYAGYAIKDGECLHALKQTNIGINILDLLRQIDGVSRDVQTYFSLTSPTIRVADVSVASSG